MINNKLILKRKGGGSLIDHRPLFSQDGETLYIVWRNEIRAYSTQTADFVQEFDRAGHRIIKILTCPKNPDTIVGCTETGSLISWHSKTGTIKLTVNLNLTTENVKIKTFHIVTFVLANQTRIYRVLVTYVNEKNKKIQLEVFNYNDGRFVLQNSIKKLDNEYYLDIVGNNGNNLIALGQGIMSYIINPESLSVIRCDKVGRIITCITGHPDEECVAIGDTSGRVLLLKDISLTYKEKNFLPRTKYHWHTLPVEEIAFSSSGGHMYTGGGECVLVKWSIGNVDNKSFLPRLSAPIKHLTIAPGNLYVAISTLDNGITIVNPQKKLTSVIQSFTKGIIPSGANLFPAGLQVDPRTNYLVFNSRTGHIQYYDINTNSLVYNMNITAQNLLTQERNTVIVNTDVTKISINYDGTWMATVEERDDQVSSIEIRLKFWNFDMEKQIYVLNTCIELPHDIGINVLLFQPSNSFKERDPFVITTGKDEQFKLWNLVEPTSIYKKNKHWQCHSVGYYRDLSTNDAAFSEDGSLLAVGFDCTLTLWNPESMELKKSLSYFNKRENIKRIQFGKYEARHLVVVAYFTSLIVWDILTCRVIWSVPLNVSCLAADPLSSYMAVFTTDNTLYVFKPTKSKYEYMHESVTDNSSVVCCCFVPQPQEKQDPIAWQKYSQLYFLDDNQELSTLESESESDSLFSKLNVSESSQLTAFSRLLASQTISSKEAIVPYVHDYLGTTGKGVIDELLSVPAHTLAPMSLVCASFLLSVSAHPSPESPKTPLKSEKRETLESDDEYEGLEQDVDNKVCNSVKQEPEKPASSLVAYDWTFLSKELVPASETI